MISSPHNFFLLLYYSVKVVYYSTVAIMSLADTIKYSTPSYFTSVPEYFSNITVSPIFTSIGTFVPFSSTRPSPTAITSPVCGFSFATDARTIPPTVFSSSFATLITTRSPNGFNTINPSK
ncbi:hypothetical protein WZ342_2458 [Enterococcus faecalis]|nr:hypothetical protein WZ342_2458 [Enterococcus faecalis]